MSRGCRCLYTPIGYHGPLYNSWIPPSPLPVRCLFFYLQPGSTEMQGFPHIDSSNSSAVLIGPKHESPRSSRELLLKDDLDFLMLWGCQVTESALCWYRLTWVRDWGWMDVVSHFCDVTYVCILCSWNYWMTWTLMTDVSRSNLSAPLGDMVSLGLYESSRL